ncbi:hypothetical protein CASFOL_038754 [Castilleja foliolosa]|uniref:Uncharacterized protein n=1 Tax=Castilleja foliolosa TaxID=1961234 RepID=A0ABD3BLU2_9LAMI
MLCISANNSIHVGEEIRSTFRLADISFVQPNNR